ncbi:hypothetical protein NEDG_01179 [Nematocida displodere]|uniref:Asparagine synthetase domain-containing protein n=1 Tax=Nematocida displodere TaxID=1805483 RepID=A0A177ECC5_9MICR|nr:hypothetical protein NEDG_01179 [Nematocida displodere]
MTHESTARDYTAGGCFAHCSTTYAALMDFFREADARGQTIQPSIDTEHPASFESPENPENLANPGPSETWRTVLEYPSNRVYRASATDVGDWECEKTVSKSFLINYCFQRNGTVQLIKLPTGILVVGDFFCTLPVEITTERIRIGKGVERSTQPIYSTGPATAVLVTETKVFEVGLKVGPKPTPTPKPEHPFLHLKNLLAETLLGAVSTDKVFVSFSGGIDSFLCATLLCASLKDKQTVYLINTSFSNTDTFASKDRDTSYYAYNYLQRLATKVALVENNITRAEVLKHAERILPLCKGTTMDFNLAAIHYFTAKCVHDLGGRTVVTGSGGDELFLGYSRHRDPHADLPAMVREEIGTLCQTNLHRDARSAMLWDVHPFSPFFTREIADLALSAALPENVQKLLLVQILQSIHGSSLAVPHKLAGQFGTGISKVIRSLHCRGSIRCRNNECHSLECGGVDDLGVLSAHTPRL